jgi:DNA-binding NarL/FixJ family response regulator
MTKRRVLLLCAQPLLGEGLAAILNQESEIDLLGPWVLDSHSMKRIAQTNAEVVLIAEDESRDVSDFITQVLQTYPSLPVIRTALGDQQVHLYTSASLPARRSDLLGILRTLPKRQKNDPSQISNQGDGP